MEEESLGQKVIWETTTIFASLAPATHSFGKGT